MKNQTQQNLDQYIGHDVVDLDGNKIGRLQCLWADETGQPAYLGVQTGWIFGKTHVVPAEQTQVNETHQIIRLPYTSEKIKEAVSCDAGAEIDEATVEEVRRYYNLSDQPVTECESGSSKADVHPASAAKGQTRESAKMKLHEEEVKIGKRQVEAGGVRLRKVVKTETVNQPVELQREEIVVERVPASGASMQEQETQAQFGEEEIYIPLRREEPVIQKQSKVREEVRVSKKSQTERETISEQVRKEEVEVQQSANQFPTGRTRGRPRKDTVPESASPRGTLPTGRKQRSRKTGKRAVFCLCRSEQQASQIVDDLKRSGFSNDDISVLFADKSGTRDFAHEKHTKAPEGAATGAGAGALFGGALGWLVGVGALAIPGVGPFIAAGPIMAALSGAAIGAGTGGLIGALVGMGIPEYEAKRYEGKLKEGNILVSVHSNDGDETRRAKEIFERAGAEDISATGEEKVTSHAE